MLAPTGEGCHVTAMVPRRAQTPVAIRSDRAAARLKLLTRGGRSQAQVIEEALDRMPVPSAAALSPEEQARRARIEAAIDRLAACGLPTMAEFDAREYDENGNCR